MVRPSPQHRPKGQPITKAIRVLWDELNETIRRCHGWAVSEPHVFPLRFEVEKDSPLPALLQEAGQSIRHLGSHERLLPSTITETRGNRTIVNQEVSPGIVAVYEISMVKKVEKAPD